MKPYPLLVAALCAGCAQIMGPTPEQKAAMQAQVRANYIANLQSHCDAYGYQRGTQEYANCMMATDQAHQAAEQADFQQRRAIAASILLRQ